MERTLRRLVEGADGGTSSLKGSRWGRTDRVHSFEGAPLDRWVRAAEVRISGWVFIGGMREKKKVSFVRLLAKLMFIVFLPKEMVADTSTTMTRFYQIACITSETGMCVLISSCANNCRIPCQDNRPFRIPNYVTCWSLMILHIQWVKPLIQ